MDRTNNLLDFEQLEEAVKTIQQANRVFYLVWVHQVLRRKMPKIN